MSCLDPTIEPWNGSFPWKPLRLVVLSLILLDVSRQTKRGTPERSLQKDQETRETREKGKISSEGGGGGEKEGLHKEGRRQQPPWHNQTTTEGVVEEGRAEALLRGYLLGEAVVVRSPSFYELSLAYFRV